MVVEPRRFTRSPSQKTTKKLDPSETALARQTACFTLRVGWTRRIVRPSGRAASMRPDPAEVHLDD